MADEAVKTSAGADGKSPGRQQAESAGGGKFVQPGSYDAAAGAPRQDAGGAHREQRVGGASERGGFPLAPKAADPRPFRNPKQAGPVDGGSAEQ